MTAFEGYETVRTLFEGAITAVHAARRGDEEGAARYVVKTCRPPAILESVQADRLLTDFQKRAELQKRAASHDPGHWAPIHATGQLGREAFYVSDLYDRQLGFVVAGRVQVDERSLHAVARAISDGLRSMHDGVERGHGNLRVENVLVAGTGRLDEARIVLTDPATDDDIDEDRGVGADLQAVGELLYALVTHQAYPGPVVLPLEPDQPWKRVGRLGARWCELCNDLMAPDRPEAVTTLEVLADRIAELRVKPRATGRVKAIRAGLVVGAVAAAAIVTAILWPEPECDPDSQAFQRLAQSMAPEEGGNEMGWLRWLIAVTDRESRDKRSLVSAQVPGLGDLIDEIEDDLGDITFDPTLLLPRDAQQGTDVYAMPDMFEEEIAQISLHDWCDVQQATAHRDNAVRLIDQYLRRHYERSADLGSAGLQNVGEFLKVSVLGVDPHHADRQLVSTVEAPEPAEVVNPEIAGATGLDSTPAPIESSVQEQKPYLYDMESLVDLASFAGTGSLDAIEQSHAGIVDRIQPVERAVGGDDAVIRALNDLIADRSGSPIETVDAVHDLADTMEVLRQRVDDMAKFVEDGQWDQVETERFRRECDVYTLTAVEETHLERWLSQARLYVPVSRDMDPRFTDATWDWGVQLEELERHHEELGQLNPLAAQSFDAEIASTRSGISGFIDAQRIVLLVDVDTTRDRAAGYRRDLSSLRSRVVAEKEEPCEWYARVTGRLDDSPFANAAVSDAQERLLRARLNEMIDCQDLSRDENRRTYIAAWRHDRAVETYLNEIDGLDSPAFLVGDDVIAATMMDLDQARPWLDGRRQQALGELIGVVRWEELDPFASDDERHRTIDAWRVSSGAWTTFEEDVTTVEAALRTFGIASADLQVGRLGDEISGNEDAAVGEVYAQCRRTFEDWSQRADAEALGPLINTVRPVHERLARLEEIRQAEAAVIWQWLDSAADQNELLAEIAYTLMLWARVCEVREAWAATHADTSRLEQIMNLEVQFQQQMAEGLARLPSERQEALRERIGRERRSGWIDYARVAAARAADEPSALEAVLARRSSFGVELDAGHLDGHPALEFNVCKFDCQQVATDQANDALENTMRAFTAALSRSHRSRPVPGDGQATIARLLDELNIMLSEEEEPPFEPDSLKVGPPAEHAVGEWKHDGPAQFAEVPEVLCYRWTDAPRKNDEGEPVLCFRCLNPTDEVGPYTFLCTDELSIGMFIDLIDAADRWSNIATLKGDFHLRPRFEGQHTLRTWQWVGDRIEPAEAWLDWEEGLPQGVPGDDEAPPYFSEALATWEDNRPTTRHPVTFIGAAAAAYVAQLAGCRLPTDLEWQDASQASAARQKPNLRDETWRKLVEHLRAMQLNIERAAQAKGREVGTITRRKRNYDWPDQFLFWPPRLLDERSGMGLLEHRGENAQPATSDDDGELWLRETAPGERETFRNLLGNVQEYVIQDQGWLPDPDAGVNAKAISRAFFRAENLETVRVIGGSALSPGRDVISPDEAQPMTDRPDRQDGYADVGLRLAFTVTEFTPPLGIRLRRALENTPYLDVD